MLARFANQGQSRPDTSSSRALFVAALIVLWMVGISARLVYLQVSRHDKLVERARQQQQDEVDTLPQRGSLLDCQGRELARSVDTVSLFVAPDEISDYGSLECLVQTLSESLSLNHKHLLEEIQQAKAASRRFLWVARRVEADQANNLVALNLPGLHFRDEPKRYYPNGSLAAHVLGYVGIDGIGLGGVERTYNEKISGESGKLFLEKDSGGRVYESLEIPAKPGQTLVLTIDQSIQYKTEQALSAAVEQSRAKSGTAIVLDPRTGEILALANAPTFDPNNVGTTKAEARRNWALENIYEPGSTFKIVAFSAAIEKGLVKPSDKIDCQMGSITVAGRLVHDHHAFGSLTIAEALAKSSNVAAIKLGIRVGDPSMYEYITRFGFGSKTGVELPGETAGILRQVNRWQPSSIGSIAIGQEVGVTPLQMVAAFGALANNGLRVAPHLVREIRTSNGETLYRARPDERRVISEETAIALRGMLEGVTLKGTAKKAQLDGYSAAGKTGTAQKIDPKTRGYSKTKHVASFVGFAPVGNPAAVIIVVIDEPAGSYHGGDVAAPVFRAIAEQVLPELGTMPDTQLKASPELIAQAGPKTKVSDKADAAQRQVDDARKATLPTVAPNGDGSGEIVYAAATNKSILMPDLRGRSVRDVARACAQLGLQVEARGEGRVTRQNPAPGSEIESGRVVYFEFGRAN
ncbi:MAG TPA: penicillin-binding protein [Pyrinomonadaceae bacterium]|nr:penicillin-binding protein [Pyrinomonadaceae bacterium]